MKIDAKTYEAALRRGRLERAIAFRAAAAGIMRGLRDIARTLVALIT